VHTLEDGQNNDGKSQKLRHFEGEEANR